MTVTEEIRAKALNLLEELQERQLEVCLVEAPERRHAGHKIRVVCNSNPVWYRRLCAQYVSNRKGRKTRTKIKRASTIEALNRIASGTARTEYDRRILNVLTEKKPAKPYDFAEFKF